MARGPQPIGEVIADIIARRGLAREVASRQRDEAWQEIMGEDLAAETRLGPVRRGRLDVIVIDSALAHELTFQKEEIIAKIEQRLPELGVTSLRFRVGSIAPPPPKN